MEPTTAAVRPALDTLRELDERRFLDKLAIAIHEATNAVQDMGRPAKISITLDFAPLSKQQLAEPVITVECEILTKLPKPEGHRALFYIDAQGNPTTQQQRQRGLDLQVAGRPDNATKEGTSNT